MIECISQAETSKPPFVRCGKIHFGGSHFRLPCVVKALSNDAACLHVFGADRLPDRFWLVIELIALEVECEIISRTERTVTVAFEKLSSKSTEHTRSDRSLSENFPADQSCANSTAASDMVIPRLWIVEDDEDDCTLLSDAFRRQNFLCEMKFFKDGAAFIDHLLDNDPLTELKKPALTLLDINMPRMDGIETLSRLRADMRFRHLPVVMFTTSNREQDIQKTYTLGVSAYISKPSVEDDLVRVVDFISSYWTAGVKFPGSGSAEIS